MPPAAHFRLAESGQRPIKAGDSDFPALIIHPLKRPIRGACGPPYWMYPPGLEVAQPQGEIPKMGEPQFPLFGRFKEGVQGEGNRNPSPCRFFRPFLIAEKGARRRPPSFENSGSKPGYPAFFPGAGVRRSVRRGWDRSGCGPISHNADGNSGRTNRSCFPPFVPPPCTIIHHVV